MFNELAWTPHISEAHPSGLIFGGTEDGTVVFFDADKLINRSFTKVENSSLSVLSSRRDHHGHILSVDYSIDRKWAISAGGSAQLLLWDLTNLKTPFSPGVPNFPDQIKRVRWNLSVEQIIASVSSHRCSIWDIRRPGASILEFGEVGGGCDWADISWNPSDSSTLVICSQSDTVPLMQKWDLRYPTAPVMDYAIHHKGVTAINWLVNTSTYFYYFVVILIDDRVRFISWSEVKPNLLAVQYFQHPVQISSVEPIALKKEVGLNLVTKYKMSFPLELSLVPLWVEAAPVGVSFALGGQMVTHYKQWDNITMTWNYCVNIKHVSFDPILYADAIELQNACDNKQLGAFCEDRALASSDHSLLLLWTFLSAQVTNQSRREYIRLLGYNGDDGSSTSPNFKISSTSNEVSHITEELSRMATSQTNGRASVLSDITSDTSLQEVFEQQPQIDWGQIGKIFKNCEELPMFYKYFGDYDSWSILDMMIEGNDEQVVDILLERKDFPSAFLIARQQPILMRRIIDKYLAEDLSTPLRFLAILATNNLDQLIDTFPINEWKRLLGIILAKEDRGRIVKAMKRVTEKLAGGHDSLVSALPAILAGDVQSLLMANRQLSLGWNQDSENSRVAYI
uniref:WD_REPEATS_REGION domain-containing protein n=1 Tax=Heterorhabditis bacteriophora TaxID=37862 RepID=A0A1I7WF15_HETBA